jgi:hypothetical protein
LADRENDTTGKDLFAPAYPATPLHPLILNGISSDLAALSVLLKTDLACFLSY